MMDLHEKAEEQRFRSEARDWLAEAIPESLRGSDRFEDRLAADRLLAERGFLGFTWPVEFGGAGASPALAAILDEERARIGIPTSGSPSRFGVNLLGPTLMRHGTIEQQRAFLPPILRAEQIWCQGFSEPEAGSDLANVQCTLTDRGDHLALDGSKIWTTQAHEADWCFALVRSDLEAPRHRNLSYVLVEMNRPGIEIQPLVQLTGAAEFTQVFFDDVKIEVGNVVGAPGEGWRIAMTTLSAERTYSQLSRYSQYVRQLERLAGLVDVADGGALEELGRIRAHLTGVRNLSLKIASMATAGDDVGTLASVTKLWWSTTHQRLVDLGYRTAVARGTDEDYWYRLWLEARGETIYAGASQIQRNIIAERRLGLPRS